MDQENGQQGGFQTDATAEQGITAQDVLAQAEGIEAQAEVAEQEEVQETKEEQKEETREEKLFASKFAALSRKEKAVREREALVERRMAEIEQKFKELEERSKPKVEEEESEPLEFLIKKNPLEALKKAGLDYETLTQIALNDGKLTPEMQIRLMREEMERQYNEKFQQLESKLTEKEQREEEERHQQVISGFKNQISSEIATNVAEYELLSVEGNDGIDLVYDVIEEHYNESGAIMDVKEAATLVEEYLLEEAKKRVNLGKVRKLLGASETQAQAKKPEGGHKESVTLSNSQSQVSQTGERFLSDDESKMSAAKLIKWIED